MTIPLPPYEAPFKPVPQITPFTYRDGVTMLKKLELLQRYINRTLVPFVNDNMEELGDAFETQVNALIEAVNAAIDLVIESGVTVQDPVVASIFQNAASATRIVTDALYAAKSLEGSVSTLAGRVTNTENAITTIQDQITVIQGNITTLTTNLGTTNSNLTTLTNRVDRAARHVKDYGAVGNGTTDDTTALQNAINAGVPLYWGGPDDIYKITAPLVRTLTKNLIWRSDGATIKVDSVASIIRAVEIQANGFSVSLNGPLAIDANQKAFTAWYINNGISTFADFSAYGISARNVLRANTSMVGGDGIHVRGLFRTVNITNPEARNILMSAGAGVSGSQGVAGITVSSAGAGLAPIEINIVNPYVENVYSLDDAYLLDQDGIRIFTEEDTGSVVLFETHFTIRGGKIKNCGGRGIKSQCEFGVIDGVMFVRRSTPFASRQGSMPEIDFQTGGGTVTNCEFQYASSTPATIILWSGTRQVGGKYSNGVTVTNCKVSYSGGQQINKFFAANLQEQVKATIILENIEVVNYANYLQEAFAVVLGPITAELIIRLVNITAPLNAGLPFLMRNSVAMPTFAGLHNLANFRTGNAKSFAYTTAGSMTPVLTGDNVRVVAGP